MAFGRFPSVTSIFPFHVPNLKGIIKQGRLITRHFLNMITMLAKISFLFLRQSLIYPLTIMSSLFHVPSLKRIIKQRRLQLRPFLAMVRTQNIFAFLPPSLMFFFSCSRLKGNRETTKLLLFASFHTKPTGVFPTYTPLIISLVTIILRN